MVRKKVTAWLLAVAMITGSTLAMAPTVMAADRGDTVRTPEIIQNNSCYINGDEVRAYQAGSEVYVVLDDLKAYGFNLAASGKDVTISWAGSDYYYDEGFSPNTENTGMETGTATQSSKKGVINGKQVTLYTVNGNTCVNATDLDDLGYSKYDADKNIMNIYITAAGYEDGSAYRNITVDAAASTGQIKSLLGMHYDLGEAGSETSKVYIDCGVDTVRTHDIDGTSGDGRGIIYNICPDYFDTVKAIAVLDKDVTDLETAIADLEKYISENSTAEDVETKKTDLEAKKQELETKKTERDTKKPELEAHLKTIDLTQASSYDFEALDKVIDNIEDINAEIFFRYGASQNDIQDNTFPAIDTPEWDTYLENLTTIAGQIINHYQYGWDDGYYDVLDYFEIWNEPDLCDFWPNTAQHYYEMYDSISKEVRALDADLPIGGPAITTENDDRGIEASFLKYISENNCPLDFYSYHYYPSNNADPYDYTRWALHFKNLLAKYGYNDIPLMLSEYGTALFCNPFTMSTSAEKTYVTTAMMYLQDSPVVKANAYFGFTGRDGEISSTYYAYQMLKPMNDTSNRLSVTGADKNGMAVLAGSNGDNSQINVLISNYEMPTAQMLSNNTDESHNPMINDNKMSIPGVANWSLPLARVMTYTNNQGYNLTVQNVPFNTATVEVKQYRSDVEHAGELVSSTFVPVNADGTVILSNDLITYSADLLTITAGQNDISKVSGVSLSYDKCTYSGKEMKPVVSITGLTQGTDFDVAYKNNVKAGTATVTITGKGAYVGTMTKTFTINKMNVSKLKVKLSYTSTVYNGKTKCPSVTIAGLKKGTDYKVSGSQKKIGTGKVTIKGIGNYTGEITKTFKVVPKKANLLSVKKNGSKKLKVTWKKDTTVTGYEIQYSLKSNFKSARKQTVKSNKTNNYTLKKLKANKKYYVRIRSYKTVSGKKIAGSWSSVKKCATK